MKCLSCSQEIPGERVVCPSCGTAVADKTAPTFMKQAGVEGKSGNGGERLSKSPTRPTTYDSIDNSRFVPGTILAARYRIAGLLGRGGMGEVYRADDLKLAQPVALKFLPERLLNDGAALARFHREVRVARQISHRNVCRVYDIGEVDGHHFLSMEYIKGEELASLLRRIGRLPQDKAVEIARQLCAGLAAAHSNNVLHRDLKPSNVMIDEEGNVRITDFGLAGLAEEFREEERHAGTPAYMAPEQLHGESASIRSDIYSLGLVLYEIFTGRRAFEAASLAELIELRKSETTPTSPSSHVKEIDPVAERIILRCLEREPEKRPSSALSVAAALPGGDPLAAALAAGETPSPEMVAAALKEGALRPWVALACLASVILVLAGLVIASTRLTAINKVPMEKSPEILGERAREIVRKLGYAEAPLDTDRGFSVDTSYLDYVEQQGESAQNWNRIRTGQPLILYFWYRQSPRYMEKLILEASTVPAPALNVSGFTHLSMDTRGRLVEFYRAPQQMDTQAGAATEPDWSALFAAAEINPAGFQPADSQWVPPVAYDTRKAWAGSLPDHPEIPLRIEAAGFKSKPVYFQLIYPWTKPARQEETEFTGREWVALIALGIVITAVVIGAILLARRNLRMGRGDRKGAFKLAFFAFTVLLVSMFLAADHAPSPGRELWTLYVSARDALFVAFWLWLIYIALEPYVRRFAPRLLISWSRLLAGDFRDPMIGRDVLVGGLLGLGHTVAIYIGVILKERLSTPGSPLLSINTDTLRGYRVMLMSLLGSTLLSAVYAGLAYLFFLLLMYILVKKPRLAGILMWLTILVIQVLFFASSWHIVISNLLIATLLTATVARFGLLAAISWHFFFSLSFFWPLTTNFSLWYSSATILSLVVLIGLAVYGFYTSLAGQPLFREGILKE
ncbi:MAG TPA: serine/threonine-protein kinase [Pyrinomonadaceae bacterium]|nr:serine/threonine-protein kinase [Pyrinomonadaceae bacterium]